MADVMKLPPLGDKAIEAYYDQTGIQEEGRFRVEKEQVRSFLVHSVSRPYKDAVRDSAYPSFLTFAGGTHDPIL